MAWTCGQCGVRFDDDCTGKGECQLKNMTFDERQLFFKAVVEEPA